jgi:hypothetical protein
MLDPSVAKIGTQSKDEEFYSCLEDFNAPAKRKKPAKPPKEKKQPKPKAPKKPKGLISLVA